MVLVRHGESEGNLARRKFKQGDNSYYTEEFKKRHSSRYRLTTVGQEQAEITGKYIRENIFSSFDRYYCSDYIRARETAALLTFDGAEWFSEFYLREQDMGTSDLVGNPNIDQREQERRKLDAFYYAPPGGESIANCCLRVDIWLDALHKSCAGFRVLAVVHGNILKAMRIRLEKLRQEEWVNLKNDDNYRSYNCQIVHYSRRNPQTGKIHRNFVYVKTICPWNSKISTDWRKIEKKNIY